MIAALNSKFNVRIPDAGGHDALPFAFCPSTDVELLGSRRLKVSSLGAIV
ncbi:hypothetical protein QO002_002161 [Pararhizobium capsulatum DSM 1112]|uniref:Uncharacterized protein n=1 Tax=Pararhizobium capsulatum DSM 1112 TaxID=1121113 RepID=A0ABU0BP44_9HYPH|nr:hypothetical protein [Pararhizobium capsulatum DSM 1112]